jgi:hypothetical protein
MRRRQNYEFERNFKANFICFFTIVILTVYWITKRIIRTFNAFGDQTPIQIQNKYDHFDEIDELLDQIFLIGLLLCSSILFFKSTADIL